MTTFRARDTVGRMLAHCFPLLLISSVCAVATGCTPIPPGVAAEAIVDGPVAGGTLQRALEAERSVTNVRLAPTDRSGESRHTGGQPQHFYFSVQAMGAAWGELEQTAERDRSTRVAARISWPRAAWPSYRQQAEMEEVVRRLVGQVLLAPTDAAPPAGSAAPPAGPRYWSGN